MKSPVRRGADGAESLPDLVELSLIIWRMPTVALSEDLTGVTRKLKGFDIRGLAPEAEAELRRRLPLKEGDIIDTDGFRRIAEAVRAFDPQLRSNSITVAGGVAGGRRRRTDGEATPPEVRYYTVHIRPVDSTALE